MFVHVVHAQGGDDITIVPFLNKINDAILNPIIILLFAVAFIVFVWGVIRFVRASGNGEDLADGKRHILYGIIGMFIMVSVYGIINIALDTFGIDSPEYLSGEGDGGGDLEGPL